MNNVIETIGEDYKRWCSRQCIFIDAPTGTGKTTFVIQKLLPFCFESKEKLLYICNRSTLLNQVRGFNLMDYASSIEFMTYQSLESIIKNTSKDFHQLALYKYIVFDEAHYFFSDSIFNPYTCLSYNFIITQLTCSIKIFMSATLGQFQTNFMKHQLDYLTSSGGLNNLTCPMVRSLERHYYINPYYDNLAVRYFNDPVNDIPGLILEKTSSKWLVFVTNKSDADLIKKQLPKNISVGVITSDTKAESSYDLFSIIEYESFQSDVLLCTSCLDNGVNISDPTLTNIVIVANSEIQFKQMLGRKRRSREDITPLNLFICCRDEDYFKKIHSEFIYPRLEFVKNNINNPAQITMKLLESEAIYNLAKNTMIMCNNQYSFSNTTYLELTHQNQFLRDIIKTLRVDRFSFIKLQLSWLGITDTFSEKNFYSYNQKENATSTLTSLLKDQCGTKMDKNANTAFLSQCKPLIEIILGPSNNTFKNLQTLGSNKFNKFCSIVSFNYHLERTSSPQGSQWTLMEGGEYNDEPDEDLINQ